MLLDAKGVRSGSNAGSRQWAHTVSGLDRGEGGSTESCSTQTDQEGIPRAGKSRAAAAAHSEDATVGTAVQPELEPAKMKGVLNYSTLAVVMAGQLASSW